MFKLGIIGSDNSHAIAFSKLANLEGGFDGLRVEDARVTHIYGTDPERTKEVAEAGEIPQIVERKEDMIGEVDGVLCVWRHGALHLPDTLPFLEAGIPAFVDKPLATTVEDAKKLIDAAEKAGVGFTSFSTLRFSQSVEAFVAELPEKTGTLTAGVSTGPADLKSEYGGLFFYGIHAVELMNTVWGYGCRSVHALEHNGNVMATCRFDSGPFVTLNLLGNASYVFHLAAFGTKGWQTLAVDASSSYRDGLKIILDTLVTGKWPLSREELLEPVKILTAINRSLQETREVDLDEV